jgi:hypothetical protein
MSVHENLSDFVAERLRKAKDSVPPREAVRGAGALVYQSGEFIAPVGAAALAVGVGALLASAARAVQSQRYEGDQLGRQNGG